MCGVEGKGGATEVRERTFAFPISEMLEGSEQRTSMV